MNKMTPRDKSDVKRFEDITGLKLIELDRYLSGQWEWYQLWDYNFSRVDTAKLHCNCKCKYEGIKAAYRRKGYPLSIGKLEKMGFNFIKISGGKSWYEDGIYRCSCGQKWKEEFIEAMQYNGNHAHPIDD